MDDMDYLDEMEDDFDLELLEFERQQREDRQDLDSGRASQKSAAQRESEAQEILLDLATLEMPGSDDEEREREERETYERMRRELGL